MNIKHFCVWNRKFSQNGTDFSHFKPGYSCHLRLHYSTSLLLYVGGDQSSLPVSLTQNLECHSGSCWFSPLLCTGTLELQGLPTSCTGHVPPLTFTSAEPKWNVIRKSARRDSHSPVRMTTVYMIRNGHRQQKSYSWSHVHRHMKLLFMTMHLEEPWLHHITSNPPRPKEVTLY